MVSTNTSTSVTPGSRSMTEPSSTASPLISNVARDVSLLSRTFRVTTKSSVVVPSAAVTETLSSFSPVARSESPVTM